MLSPMPSFHASLLDLGATHGLRDDGGGSGTLADSEHSGALRLLRLLNTEDYASLREWHAPGSARAFHTGRDLGTATAWRGVFSSVLVVLDCCGHPPCLSAVLAVHAGNMA